MLTACMFTLQVVGGCKACPQVFDRAHKGNSREGIQPNGVAENDEGGGDWIKHRRIDGNERIVTNGIDHESKSAPDHDEVHMLYHLDRRRAERLRGPFCTWRPTIDTVLFPGRIQAKHQHDERKLE